MASSTTTNSGLQLQELDRHSPLTRRSFGRRKAKAGSDSKKNKQPRRGMGVAKLERLRLQETEQQRPAELPPPFPEVNPSSYFAQMGPTVGFHGLALADSSFIGRNRDLIGGGLVKCYALHCNACLKEKLEEKLDETDKKKTNNDRRILELELGDKKRITNQDFGSYGNKVEVVGVERKGRCGGWEDGNGVLREYDFFPAAVKSEEEMKQQVGFLGSSSSSMAAASNCVDLSLKLSNF